MGKPPGTESVKTSFHIFLTNLLKKAEIYQFNKQLILPYENVWSMNIFLVNLHTQKSTLPLLFDK